MPLNFAFRVLDVFFLEGPKVLFQVGLAILRINGEELLDATDDGTFISVLKSYFTRLGDSAHPKSENPKLRAVTNFQALMVVAFKEFSGITQNTISEQRARHKNAVLDSIETFAKRTSIRNLGPDSKKLSAIDLGFLYDRFYGVLYERQQRLLMIQQETERRAKAAQAKATEIVSGISANAPEMGRVGMGPSPTQMDYDAFREFLAGICKWAITDSPTSPTKDAPADAQANGYFGNSWRQKSISLSPWGAGPEPTEHDFMQRLFRSWKPVDAEDLSLQNVVSGLARVKGPRDIMSNISNFFDLYDEDKDERIDREGILRISEGLLFLSRRGVSSGSSAVADNLSQLDISIDGTQRRRESKDEQFLSSISAFIRRCFEYADPDQSAEPAQQEAGDLLDLDGESAATTSDMKAEGDEQNLVFGAFGQVTSRKNASANAALDPNHPLFLTLPAFRMLVLADEALESFFDSGFPNSFHLADAPLPSSTVSSMTNLTTFGNMPPRRTSELPVVSPGPPAAGVVPPGKGLRGMLDNIVTDGMRVASEVRRRMDEAQKELDKGAVTRGTEEDDDEDELEETGRDLLEGADAEAAGTDSARPSVSGPSMQGGSVLHQDLVGESKEKGKARAEDVEKSTVFER